MRKKCLLKTFNSISISLKDCDGDSFRCWDGSCISASKKCDGIPDCPNQADEVECGLFSQIQMLTRIFCSVHKKYFLTFFI